jgi:antitoxin VapB
MGLNIKNERVHELARQAARRTGTTQTSAIEAALVTYLASLDAPTQSEETQERLTSLLRRIDARLTDADRAAIRRDLENLYDDRGLPA